jgi:hypothetical protein
MARKPPALARELLRNFPKRRRAGGRSSARRRRKGPRAAADGNGAAPEIVAEAAGQAPAELAAEMSADGAHANGAAKQRSKRAPARD